MWTGEKWWSAKGEITPARWERSEGKKTKKLLKSFMI
jgi:hypothetical protein